jgi:protein tyrosine phosphatase (PTP) superfamily phosphohydrolase (DUF442 family)
MDQARIDVKKAAKRRRRRRRIALALVAACFCSAALTFRRPWFEGNFGVVEPGRVYRSAQPGEGLEETIRAHRLATVLNLRGGSRADAFYANEVRVTQQAGVDFYDFPMSAVRRPTREELLTLLDLFPRCRYPLLIHCKSGADRTGLASALYLMCMKGLDPAEARGAFSLNYGHVPLAGTQRLHDPLDEYERWLSERKLTHSAERFRAWVANDYQSRGSARDIRPLRPGPRESVARDQSRDVQARR